MGHITGDDDWAMTELNSRAIAKLIADLAKLDKTGFDNEVCKTVKDALGTLVTETKKPKNGGFLPDVLSDLDRLRQCYEEWNGYGTKGDPASIDGRRERVDELIGIRRKVQSKLKARRRAGQTPVTTADRKIINATFSKLVAVAEANPTIFNQLRTSANAKNMTKFGLDS
mgnify:CR=1 FL=1